MLGTAFATFVAVASGAVADTVAPPANMEVRGAPEVPASVVETLARYRNARSAVLVDWIGDDVLVATRFGDSTQLHRVETPLGMRRQVTFFDEPVRSAAVNPQISEPGFVFLKDIGGSESYQLFWRPAGGGAAELISDGRSRYTGVSWSPSGGWLGYTTTERNGRDWDLHARSFDPETGFGATTVIQEGAGVGWSLEDWSADEDRVLVSKYVSINEAELYEIDLGTGERRQLLPDPDATEGVAIGGAVYGAGNDVYYTSDAGSEFMQLRRLTLATGESTTLTEDVNWNVGSAAVSRDRARIAWTFNEGGYSRLQVAATADGEAVALPTIPDGIIGRLRFSPDGQQLAFTLSRPVAPSDVYSIDLGSGALTRWTASELGGLREEALAAPELVHFESFDGLEIPAFVYRPAGAGPHPVLVNIHGGPEGQARPGFSPSSQFYVQELGLAVVIPNVRGSAGYGKSWLKLDNGRLREDSVRDIGALLDWIGEQPELDENRIAVTGGSYGGYMVLASMVHFADRIRAGVERVGISNFVSFLENTQAYRRDLRRAEYGDERDPGMRAFLEGIAPLHRAHEIAAPLLIAQGLNDPRVPASESEQIAAALAKSEIPVWYVLAKDEGHGFAKKPNADYLAALTAMFLERHVLQD